MTHMCTVHINLGYGKNVRQENVSPVRLPLNGNTMRVEHNNWKCEVGATSMDCSEEEVAYSFQLMQ